MNPPYGRELGLWIEKALEEGELVTVVCLIPARTDTRYFHEYCVKASEIRFVRGRIKFMTGGQIRSAAPFPSMLVIFRPGHKGMPIFSVCGPYR